MVEEQFVLVAEAVVMWFWTRFVLWIAELE